MCMVAHPIHHNVKAQYNRISIIGTHVGYLGRVVKAGDLRSPDGNVA